MSLHCCPTPECAASGHKATLVTYVPADPWRDFDRIVSDQLFDRLLKSVARRGRRVPPQQTSLSSDACRLPHPAPPIPATRRRTPPLGLARHPLQRPRHLDRPLPHLWRRRPMDPSPKNSPHPTSTAKETTDDQLDMVTQQSPEYPPFPKLRLTGGPSPHDIGIWLDDKPLADLITRLVIDVKADNLATATMTIEVELDIDAELALKVETIKPADMDVIRAEYRARADEYFGRKAASGEIVND